MKLNKNLQKLKTIFTKKRLKKINLHIKNNIIYIFNT